MTLSDNAKNILLIWAAAALGMAMFSLSMAEFPVKNELLDNLKSGNADLQMQIDALKLELRDR